MTAIANKMQCMFSLDFLYCRNVVTVFSASLGKQFDRHKNLQVYSNNKSKTKTEQKKNSRPKYMIPIQSITENRIRHASGPVQNHHSIFSS